MSVNLILILNFQSILNNLEPLKVNKINTQIYFILQQNWTSGIRSKNELQLKSGNIRIAEQKLTKYAKIVKMILQIAIN